MAIKQTLLTLLLCMTSLLSIAQEQVEYCKYTFDGTKLPEGFATYDRDGGTLHFTAIQMGFNQGDSWICLREAGVTPFNYFAASYSRNKIVSGQDAVAANDWLVMPSVFVRDNNATLTWRSNSFSENLEQTSTYSVRISTTGNTPEDFTDIALTTIENDPLNEWKEHSVKIEGYAGKQVYIAFVNVTLQGECLGIDDIQMTGSRGAFEFTTNADTYICGKQAFTPTLTFTQLASTPITSFTTHCKNLATNEVVDKEVTNLNLAVDESIQVELMPEMSVTYGDTLKLSTWITVNGENSDALNTSTVFLSFQPKQYVVIEEGTGTWCGWCPRGIAAIKQMKRKYGEQIIPICVHFEDNMEVSGYVSDNGIRFPLGFPSGQINRRYETTPMKEVYEGSRTSVWTTLQGGFETYFIMEQERMPMAEIALDATIEGSTIKMESATTFCIAQKNADLRMAYILTEDTWSSPTESQNNYLSGVDYPMEGFESQPQKIFNFEFEDIARGAAQSAFRGIAKSIPTSISVDTPYEHTTSMAIPSNVGSINNCSLNALLIDNKTGYIVAAKRISLEDKQVGITNVNGNNQSHVMTYDLQGRKVNAPTKGHIYIVNGKKIMQ